MARGPALYTTTYTVNAVGDPEPVIAHTECVEIIVKEDPSVPDWPTVAYNVIGSAPGSTPIGYAAGTEHPFKSGPIQPFGVGDIVGYIETVTGSTTFQQKEFRK
jgi:hypothetical protein